MAVTPPVPGTKMADVCKFFSLENLLARITTWLVLTTTSSTSILSRVFGAYYMTKISINALIFQHFFSSTFSLIGSTHSFQCDFQREHTLSLSISTNRVNTLFLFFTFDFQLSTATKMYTPCNHSLPCYTFSEGFFSSLKHRNFVKILSQHA